MRRWMDSNTGYKVLAVLLATLLWLYVSGKQNPIQETVLDVPMETYNLKPDLVVSSRPTSVQVRVQGRRSSVTSLSSRELKATLDLGTAKEGVNLIPVRAILPEGIELVGINPYNVEVEIDSIFEVQLPVEVDLKGKAADGYTSLKPVLTPSRVLLTGPRKLLENLDRVYVEVSLQNKQQTLKEILPVLVKDKRGNPVQQWVQSHPPLVSAMVPVVPDRPSRVLPVQLRFSGEPAPGYVLEQAVAEPANLQVFGAQRILNGLSGLPTQPIILDGLQGEETREAVLDLPEGVSLSQGYQKLVVTLVVKKKLP